MNFDRCIEISKALKGKFQTGRAFHCTFAYKKNKLLAIGINNYSKTHPLTSNYLPTKNNNRLYIPVIHSEVSAIIKIGVEDCSDITFVNVRIDNNNLPTMAKPCSNCFGLLRDQVGYKKIYYTNNNGFFEELTS
jgi:cytidine deaminase